MHAALHSSQSVIGSSVPSVSASVSVVLRYVQVSCDEGIGLVCERPVIVMMIARAYHRLADEVAQVAPGSTASGYLLASAAALY